MTSAEASHHGEHTSRPEKHWKSGGAHGRLLIAHRSNQGIYLCFRPPARIASNGAHVLHQVHLLDLSIAVNVAKQLWIDLVEVALEVPWEVLCRLVSGVLHPAIRFCCFAWSVPYHKTYCWLVSLSLLPI